MGQGKIRVTGAREHNLKDVSLELGDGKLICFTGVSGSGKSSFAFDTLFAEGQRRYLESLSSYARQFLGQLAKPDVDKITGLRPAIAIQQKTSGWNPRSTVGTITQVHDYLRVLFARVGRPHCPRCGDRIAAQSREQIVQRVLSLPTGTKILILGPVIRGQKGEHRELFEELIRKGYARARVDGRVYALTEPPALARHVRHDIEVVIDRLTVSEGGRARIAEAVELALKIGEGTVMVSRREAVEGRREEGEGDDPVGRWRSGRGTSDSAKADAALDAAAPGGQGNDRWGDLLLSSKYACAKCGVSFEAPSPQLFSFNSPQGMCTQCDGLGVHFDFDPELLVPDPKKTFFQFAIDPMRIWMRIGKWRRHIYRGVARHVGFDLDVPWEKLPRKARDAILYGLGDEHVTFEWKWSGGVWRHGGTFAGVIAELRENHRKAQSPMVRAYYEKYMRKRICPACQGSRLNPQASAVRMGGKSITEVCMMSVRQAREWAGAIAAKRAGLESAETSDGLTETEWIIAGDVLREIEARLKFLCDVGLDYLRLDRTAPTLSGGESQRIRLASQIGAGLVGVLYILDEPSIGLHPRDNRRLLDSLLRLRDMGNTVIVVEHDEQTMRTADEIVDFGPGPGIKGGEVVGQGDLQAIMKSKRSLTGRFLRGEETIEVPKKRRKVVPSGSTKNPCKSNGG